MTHLQLLKHVNNLTNKIFFLFTSIFFFLPTQVFSIEDEKNKMTSGAQMWVAKELSVQVETIKITPPDKRVKVSKCKRKIRYDFPFESRETVRAKCSSPSWQFFLRVSSDDQTTLKSLRPIKNIKKKQVPIKFTTVLVAKKNIMKGERLNKNTVVLEKKLKNKMPVDVFTQIDGLENQEMTRNIKAGQVIRSIDIKAAKLIKKGDKVLFSIMAQGMLVKAIVEALEDGGMGDQIKLLNKDSGKTVIGVVVGKNQVKGL